MDSLIIKGGRKLRGNIPISGAKNALLPIMVASLLTKEEVCIENVPDLSDMQTLRALLVHMGVGVRYEGGHLYISGGKLSSHKAPYQWVSKMRAGFWIIAPLLAVYGEAEVSVPGGCAIGTRAVNFYLDALAQMGAELALEEGYVKALAPNGLRGADIRLSFASVGTTHILLMAGALAEGDTIIRNAACEPEVVALGAFLQEMGAVIEGLGSGEIRVKGVRGLKGARVRIAPDRIEAGSYALAIAMSQGEGVLQGADISLMGALAPAMCEGGAVLEDREGGLYVKMGGRPEPVNIVTAPYPGFPTDLQAQFMAWMSICKGECTVQETIFENRFMHVQELVRLGADIRLSGELAHIRGVGELYGARVMATDLRASMSLVIAALFATGTTSISRLYHLDRGFETLEIKLHNAKADIERIREMA